MKNFKILNPSISYTIPKNLHFYILNMCIVNLHQVRYNNPVLIDKHPEAESPAPGGVAGKKDGKGEKGKGGGDGR